MPPKVTITRIPSDRQGEPLLDLVEPKIRFEDLILSDEIQAQLDMVKSEFRHAKALTLHGLRPSDRLLFDGPPGVGKTASAEAMAHELGLPFLVARHESLITSYLGETGSNVRKVFEFAGLNRAVVLIDEFDSFGGSRSKAGHGGASQEMARVLNGILQLMERHRGPAIIIAATNLPGMLDEALERRFDVAIKFRLPTPDEADELVRRNLQDPNGASFGGSHAEIVRECLREKKRRVLRALNGR